MIFGRECHIADAAVLCAIKTSSGETEMSYSSRFEDVKSVRYFLDFCHLLSSAAEASVTAPRASDLSISSVISGTL